jgi:hypothetical protein
MIANHAGPRAQVAPATSSPVSPRCHAILLDQMDETGEASRLRPEAEKHSGPNDARPGSLHLKSPGTSRLPPSRRHHREAIRFRRFPQVTIIGGKREVPQPGFLQVAGVVNAYVVMHRKFQQHRNLKR